MPHPLLTVKELKKYFPVSKGVLRRKVADIKAVDGVSFSVEEGEVVGIVGESGSGKSTLGRAAIRLIEPTSGEVKYRGDDLLTMDHQALNCVRREVQMVFQDPYASLNPRRSVGDSIGEALTYHRIVKSHQKKVERVGEILELVGLSPEVMKRYPHEFSGGQQQRICIGRAIAMDPKLVICDEAVSALDISVQAQILNLFVELKKKLGLSYLFISHDLSVIRYVCDHVIVMYLGKVMESGRTEELFSNPKHPYTRALLSAVPVSHPDEKHNRIKLVGEIPTAMSPPSGCPFRTRCPYARKECSQVPPLKVAGNGHTYQCILDTDRYN
ncbi:MAG: oligopeptide/dipeptide ABC transporter ATP-binding protein [Chlamydiota bacterium]